MGLEMSTETNMAGESKSAIWCPSLQPDPLALGIMSITDTGFTHLGAPVGDIEFTARIVKKRVEKARQLMESLPSLNDPHAEFVLLRACFSLPKVSYSLRTSPPALPCLNLWTEFDSNVRHALNQILGSNLTDQAWKQAQLPVFLSGLGLLSAERHASAHFLASQSQSSDLVAKSSTLTSCPLPPPLMWL